MPDHSIKPSFDAKAPVSKEQVAENPWSLLHGDSGRTATQPGWAAAMGDAAPVETDAKGGITAEDNWFMNLF